MLNAVILLIMLVLIVQIFKCHRSIARLTQENGIIIQMIKERYKDEIHFNPY